MSSPKETENSRLMKIMRELKGLEDAIDKINKKKN